MITSSTPRAVLRSLAALLGLAVLVVGVPAVLWAAGGTPLPGEWPSLAGVRAAAVRPDDGSLFLILLVAAGWLGWGTFVLSLVVEVPAALRGRAAPRLPGLGRQQRLVAGLVATVAAVGAGGHAASASVPVAAPASASAASAPVEAPSSGPWEPAPPVTTDLLEASARAGTYVVVPGDTLWEVAGARLDDPLRYPEIFAASRATAQPGGRRLTDPDLILPGWTLTIPERTGGRPALPDTGAPPAGASAGPAHGVNAPGDGMDDPGAGRGATDETGEGPETPSGEGSSVPAGSAASSGDDTGEVVRTAGGVGAVLAAALVGVLATRRARERRRRRPGERIGAGDASDRSAETELRQAADPVAVEVVDRVLRGLAARLARAGRGLPPLRAVRLTRRTLEVYLAAPAELPAPFVGTAHGGVWTVPLDAVGDGEAADVPAPYPSLVTLGHDHDDALVLLDLEQVGTLVMDGAPELVRSALTAVAAELATSAWADDLRVTLVGAQALADLDLLDTCRVRHVTDVEDLLAELTVRVADDRLLLATAGVNSLGAARVAQVADAAWTPEIVVIAEPLPAEQWDRLEALIVTAPRVAVAAVVGTGEPSDLPSRGHRLRERVRHAGGGTWVLRLSGPPGRVTAVLDPLGVLVRPQLLDEETHGRFLRLLRAAARPDGSASASGDDGRGDGVADERRRVRDASGDRGGGDGVPGGRARGGAASGERESELGDGSVGGGTQRDGGATPGGRRRSGGASAGGASVASGDGAGDRGSGEAGTGYGSSDSAGGRSTDRRSADAAPVGGRDEASPSDGSSQGRTARGPSQGRPSGGASQRRSSGASHSAAAPRAGQDGASLFAEPIGPATYGRGRSLPRLLMLGPVGVENAAELGEQTKLGQLTELAMFIALNPGCDATAIDEAIWPGSAVTKTTRGTAISKLRRWLGTDADGESLLPRTESGYTLRPLVRSDWDDWRDLLPQGTSRAATADLRAALQLVRGRPFSGRGRRRYAWADHLAQEMIASIVDVCHELALRSLVERDPWEALRAALLGLSVEPGMELLWRDRLKAEAAIGDGKVVLDSVEWLRATAVDLGGELEAETEDLIEELSSGWAGATRSPAGR